MNLKSLLFVIYCHISVKNFKNFAEKLTLKKIFIMLHTKHTKEIFYLKLVIVVK